MAKTKHNSDISLGILELEAGNKDREYPISPHEFKRKVPRKKKSRDALSVAIVSCATTIQDLPNPLLKLIFSYLEVRERLLIELVCRRWRLIGKLLPWSNPSKLVFDSSTQNSALRISSNDLNDSILTLLLSRCGLCLVWLELMFEPIAYMTLSSRSLVTIGESCPNLKIFLMQGVPVNNYGLVALAQGCPKLEHFALVDTRKNDCSEGLFSIVRRCTELVSLQIADVIMSDEWFSVVSNKLCAISLTNCTVLSPKVYQDLMKNCSVLKAFQFHIDGDLALDVESQFRLLNHFRDTLQLVALCFGKSRSRVVNWSEGLKNLHHLEELSILNHDGVTDKVLEVIVKECPKLKSLKIPTSRITDKGAALLKKLPLLKLDVSGNTSLTSKGLEGVVRQGKLCELSLSLTMINEEFCCLLSKVCPKLQYLDVSSNPNVTNRLVNTFRLAVQRGSLESPLKLVVGYTRISPKFHGCNGLEIDFTSQYDNFWEQLPLKWKKYLQGKMLKSTLTYKTGKSLLTMLLWQMKKKS